MLTLRIRFKSGKLLFKGDKLNQNCCRWRVTGYRTVVLPEGCAVGLDGCPACRSTPILEISNLYFNGSPGTVVSAAVSGYIDVDCGGGIQFAPCFDTTVPFFDREFIKEDCESGRSAEVWYEFEDCPGAKDAFDPGPLENKDLRIIFTLAGE
jgi:hypothetical protein